MNLYKSFVMKAGFSCPYLDWGVSLESQAQWIGLPVVQETRLHFF